MTIPVEMIGILVLLIVQIVGLIFAIGKFWQKQNTVIEGQKMQSTSLNSIKEKVDGQGATLIALNEHVGGINGHIKEQANILTTACSDIGNLKVTAATNGTRITNLEHRVGAVKTRATD